MGDDPEAAGMPNPSVERRASTSSPLPLPKPTRTMESQQDSADTGARGSDESPKRLGVLDTLAQQQQQESKRAKTMGPIWLQE
eukprot:11175679-Alexandrium_andersonii.AAC.1